MGRRSNSKKNFLSNGKEIRKVSLKKRKELSHLVDNLLKLTSVFQPTVTLAKSWEHHTEIGKLLKEIMYLESVLHEPKPSISRTENLNSFLKWLDENGTTYEGIEISSFEGYDMGLRAQKDFKEGELLLTVPRKLMMTEEDAKKSSLGALIDSDPLLQNMPNIAMALFLLLEKSNPDSFWKPYLDVLPETYSTVLYFNTEEMSAIKPSPVYEQALKLCRSIARQYAYFYNKFQSFDADALRPLAEIFTYDNYRWAVSTVMTRQNSVPMSSLDSTAFIPLWDMCNHEEGKITTDFNPEHQRGECYALREFKSGEQIFIYYGVRSNAELFLHNGFVYGGNAHDRLKLPFGVSAGDASRAQRVRLLGKLGLAASTHFTLHATAPPLSPELLAFVRIFNMDADELAKWLEISLPGDLVSSEEDSVALVGADLEARAHRYLGTRCSLMRAAYRDEPGAEDTLHRRNIKKLKESELIILDKTIKYTNDVVAKLEADKDK